MAEQMTVGEFVKELRALGTDWVCTMFGARPDAEVHSYRGYYDQASLGWEGGDYGTQGRPANELADAIEKQIGTAMTGWKGGDYTIQEATPLWLSNEGHADGCAVVGIVNGRIIVEYKRW